jgi:hypothetical protein
MPNGKNYVPVVPVARVMTEYTAALLNDARHGAVFKIYSGHFLGRY